MRPLTLTPLPPSWVRRGHVRRVLLLRVMDDNKCYPLTGNPNNPDERAYPNGVDGEPCVLQVAGVDEDGNPVGDMSTGARELMQQDMINLLEPNLSSGLCKSSMSGEVWGKNQKLVEVCSRVLPPAE